MSYAISNTEGDHLGFILLSGGPDYGDCMVRLLPADSQLIEAPESMYLSSLQSHGELGWERIKDEFKITNLEGEVVLVEKEGNMRGAEFRYVVEAL